MFEFIISILSVAGFAVICYAIYLMSKPYPKAHPPASKPKVLKSIEIIGNQDSRDYDRLWR